MDLAQRPRKRARVACTWCHERKVRCDVSIRGSPCTNCQLDGHQCAVRATANKGRALGYCPPAPDMGMSKALTHQSSLNAPMMPMEGVIPTPIPRPTDTFGQSGFMPDMWKDNDFAAFNPQIPRNVLHTPADAASYGGSNVIYSFHRFLDLKDLSRLPPEDVKYLEMKGCLHVPTGPVLDEFIRQYFLHVHPCLPMLNEAEFWDMYNNQFDQSRKRRTISLFTFQAMMFASCSFIPSYLIKSVGFTDRRTARNIFYNRAKLLYNLKAENNALSKVQGALLLSYQSSLIVPYGGTLWVTVAVQNAIFLGAHLYRELPQDDPSRTMKKRLWWSVLLRDRIMPLGLRRHLQIDPQNFDLNLDFIEESDLQDEIYNSQVYNPRTKRSLGLILNHQCQLALVLTDVITAVYSPNSYRQQKYETEQEFLASLDHIKDIKSKLQAWHDKAKRALNSSSCSDGAHESVTLYRDLTFIYYYAARAALCHYEAYSLEAHKCHIQGSHRKRLEDIRDELEDAALGTTKRVKHLLMRGIARNLPISAVAYTALPLVLNAVDIKFSGSKSESAARKGLFRYYAEIMELYSKRYDGTDAVALCIQQMLKFVEAEKRRLAAYLSKLEPGSPPGQNSAKSWSEIFVRQPRFYLRLSMTLDITISRGHFPIDHDLPLLIRQRSLMDEAQSAHGPTPKDSSPEEQPIDQDNSSNADGPSIATFIPQTDPDPPADLWQMINKDLTDDESSSNIASSVSPEGNNQTEIPLFAQTMNEWAATSPAAAAAAAAGGVHQDHRSAGMPPQFNEVNLDFFDLGNSNGGMGMDMGVGVGMGHHHKEKDDAEAVESSWANTMIDEILNAIST